MRLKCMKDIKGFLIDLDGVLYVGDMAIEGAAGSNRSSQEAEVPDPIYVPTLRGKAGDQ